MAEPDETGAPEPDETGAPEPDDLVVTARPVLSAHWFHAAAAAVFIVFVVIALVMKSDNAGAWFTDEDQWFTVLLGAVLAGGLHLFTRPRLRADATAVRMRAAIGTWRTIPWDAVVAVEFPSNARFARLRLPGDEILAIYAVQRVDRERAVATMRGLRELFARTHPGAVRRPE